MRHPQILIHESDGRLARQLEELWEKRKWAVRKVHRLEPCLRLAREGGPTVLVLKVGRHPATELALLERLTWLVPDLAAVVVGDTDNPALALAWDLGAAYVSGSSPMPEQLDGIVAGLMEAALARFRSAVGRAPEPAGRVEPETPGETSP